MKVEVIKMHRKYIELFPIGDIVEFITPTEKAFNGVISNKDGKTYNGRDMCKCFSNKCSYSDIFKKI